MPHITLEYSANLHTGHDIDALVGAVHTAAMATGVPSVSGLRTRAVAREAFMVADGSPEYGFLSITLGLMPGRPEDVMLSLLETVIDAAQNQLHSESTRLAICYSAEIHLMNADRVINRNEVAARMAPTAT